MFDGVHRGHQLVIDAAVQTARLNQGRAGVMTFYPHPSRLFRPDHPTLQILPVAVKQRILKRLGLDFLITQPFDTAFAGLSAAEFVRYLTDAIPSLATVCIGENFRFGAGRSGDADLFVETAASHGFSVVSLERLSFDGEAVSSTRIREMLAMAPIEEVNRLLGYPYPSLGTSQRGRRLGSQLGFPTINLPWRPEIAPPHGVYTVEASLDGGPRYPAVANYGIRPTVESGPAEPLLEIHLLETDPGEIAEGTEVECAWHTRIRTEQRFASFEALQTAVFRDRQKALEWFARRQSPPAGIPKRDASQ